MIAIQDEEQYEKIMERVSELFEIVDDDTPLDDKNSIELGLLCDLVEEYEAIHYPMRKPTLVEVIKLQMYEMGLSQKALAELLGISNSRVSELLSGKIEPTLKLGRIIHERLGIEADTILGV